MFLKRQYKIIFAVLLLVAVSLPAQDAPPVKHSRYTFVARFNNIDIKDFLKTMAKITRRNILIDEKLRGKITIVSYKPIPVRRAMDFLKQVLQVKGYGVIEERNLIKIVKMKKAGHVVSPQEKNPDKFETSVVSRVLEFPDGAKINRLVSLLRTMVGKETHVNGYQPTNRIVVTGYAQNIRRVVSIIEKLGISVTTPDDEENGKEGSKNVHIYRVKNMQAESLAKVLVRLENPQIAVAPTTKKKGKKKRRTTPIRPGRNRGPGKIKAVAHKESNSLVVTAERSEWKEIRSIIVKLDKVRKQVLLEALIVEVRSDRLNDFGIDWRYSGSNGPHAQFNSGNAGALLDDSGNITGNNTLFGFSLGFLDKGGDLLGLFNANVNKQNFNVLSSPQILTLDNQEAEISVGQDVPVRTQSRNSGGGSSSSTVNSFDYRPAGIKLKFTPHVNDDNVIGLDLFQEVTNIEGGAEVETNPVFSKRSVKTYISVKNKQTVVIGGLVSTEKLQSVRKIPLLGDIPLVGFMFRRTIYSTKKTNLMIFITPHVLNDAKEAERLSTYKREEQIKEFRRKSNELRLWPQPEKVLGKEKDLEQIEFKAEKKK